MKSNHPIFKQFKQIEEKIQTIIVANRQLTVDKTNFQKGNVVDGKIENGQLIALNDNFVYTSQVFYIDMIENWSYINASYVGNAEIFIRHSLDGETFSNWEKTDGNIEVSSPYFQFQVKAKQNTKINKIVIAYNEKTPNVVKVVDKIMASIGQAEYDYDVIYEYDQSGNVVKETYTGGIEKTISYKYDEKQNVIEVKIEHQNKTTIQYFEYDDNDNVIKTYVRNKNNTTSV
ncbi:MAG: hypothetical protein N2043_02140 [Ignavibacterium sp.]|nr:hypothetical protein [Ignavibacterium sp.]